MNITEYKNFLFRNYSVNACLAPLCAMDGLSIITVEGIGNSKNLHPCQVKYWLIFLEMSWFLLLGEDSKGPWFTVWFLYSWLCNVNVYFTEK